MFGSVFDVFDTCLRNSEYYGGRPGRAVGREGGGERGARPNRTGCIRICCSWPVDLVALTGSQPLPPILPCSHGARFIYCYTRAFICLRRGFGGRLLVRKCDESHIHGTNLAAKGSVIGDVMRLGPFAAGFAGSHAGRPGRAAHAAGSKCGRVFAVLQSTLNSVVTLRYHQPCDHVPQACRMPTSSPCHRLGSYTRPAPCPLRSASSHARTCLLALH